MVSVLSKTDIPCDRVDALHVLALNDDDLDKLSPDQIAAIRKIYFLNDFRTVADRIIAGDFDD